MQYTTETVPMTIITGENTIHYSVNPLSPAREQLELRRRFRYNADRILQREGVLRYYTVKGLQLGSTRVDRFLQRAQELIDENTFRPASLQ